MHARESLAFCATSGGPGDFTGKWKTGKENGFVIANYPHYSSGAYTKYTGSETALYLEDDAAYVNWGGPWRMPTGGADGEFQALEDATDYNWVTDGDVSGLMYTQTSTGKSVFFPAAGYAEDIRLHTPGEMGYYWSSSPNSEFAYPLVFSDVYPVATTTERRWCGLSIRPIAE